MVIAAVAPIVIRLNGSTTLLAAMRSLSLELSGPVFGGFPKG